MVLAPILVLVALHQASPIDALKQFIAALNANDRAAMADLIVGGKKSNLDLIPKEGLPRLSISGIHEKVSGNNALVTVTVSATNQGRNFSKSETDSWRRASGRWQLVPATLTDKNPGDLATIAAFAVNGRQMLQMANKSAKSAVCLSNLKQLGLACLMYSNDHDDKFPPKGADVKKELFVYSKNAKLWICPETGKPAYSFNSNLSGVSTTKISLPAQTVLLYEGKGGKLDFRHEGRASVGFSDGRAKLVNKAQAAALRWKP